MIRLANLQSQTEEIWGQLQGRLRKIVHESSFIGGPAIAQFESEFANYVEARACVGVGNGTDALELILEAAGIGAGDEILVPAFSFVATSEAVIRVGATPVFVDIADDLLIDPSLLHDAIGPRTRAVIPVHLHGNPFDIEGHLGDARARGILVIEDAAQAHGASVRGKMAGSLGDAAAFSFYPGKNLGAWGDAGAVTTNDVDFSQLVRRLGNHGRLGKFDHDLTGGNSRLDSLQAAVLSAKLTCLDSWLDRRRRNASEYMTELGSLPWLSLPKVAANVEHGWHQFTVRVQDRDRFRDHMKRHGVETGIHYPYSLPELPSHARYRSFAPMAKMAALEVVSIPVAEHLTEAERDKVIEAVSLFPF